jgi:hypothetical protein
MVFFDLELFQKKMLGTDFESEFPFYLKMKWFLNILFSVIISIVFKCYCCVNFSVLLFPVNLRQDEAI